MATNELKLEVAETLLKAIAEAAPDANNSGNEALESLARAYAAVVGSAPRAPKDERRSAII